MSVHRDIESERDSGNLTVEQQLAFARQFEEQQRRFRHVWLLPIGGFGLVAISALWGYRSFEFQSFQEWEWGWASLLWVLPLGLGTAVLIFHGRWTGRVARCTCCHKDIRNCHTSFCHRCGRALVAGRCSACRVDWTWREWVGSLMGHGEEVSGNYESIRHCPGCGAMLNSRFYRAGDLNDP